ncbi:MAG: YceI family protein [Bacteroidia bacterium]
METLKTEKTTTTNNWTLDKAHAKVGFTITHMLVSEIDGLFKDFDIKVSNAKEDLSDAEIEFTAKVSSIDTHNETRDAHMKKDDYFNVEKFPLIVFKSQSFKKLEGRNYELKGELTVMGVTKNIALEVTGLIGEHPMTKKTIAGFKVIGSIKRSDYGLAASVPGLALSDEVKIIANLEFIKE